MSSENPDVPSGLLLFGTNAVGKTSFIRALGVAVIMAQSGFYVSASSFHYCPYHAIYSRIWGNDNLFRGLSTFAVEMSELRVLLNQADEHSLVLGDELCSGTENESALSIFSAGLENLCKKKSTFLFATHFHEITKWEEVKELPELAFKHMSVHYDRSIDGLVYDRKLKDGPGNRMYGLEVCKSLHLNDEFLERAYSFRRKYFDNVGGVLSYKQSQYNSNKLRGMCEKCGQCMGEEIHHMIPQECADEKGYLHGGSVHKNHAANLTSLCEKCHLLEHHPHDALSDLSSVESTGSLRKKTTSKKYVFSKK
jgi:DNA mismatch repair protein MutS